MAISVTQACYHEWWLGGGWAIGIQTENGQVGLTVLLEHIDGFRSFSGNN